MRCALSAGIVVFSLRRNGTNPSLISVSSEKFHGSGMVAVWVLPCLQQSLVCPPFLRLFCAFSHGGCEVVVLDSKVGSLYTFFVRAVARDPGFFLVPELSSLCPTPTSLLLYSSSPCTPVLGFFRLFHSFIPSHLRSPISHLPSPISDLRSPISQTYSPRPSWWRTPVSPRSSRLP